MSSVTVGSKVPDFTVAPLAAGFSLKAVRGSPLVLYFYRATTRRLPSKASSSSSCCCVSGVLACRLGVSRDSVASHDKFCAKMGFRFPLLSDTDEQLCQLFDVIHEKNMYGRKVLGVVRSTFLIDARGVLRREWRKVAADGHAAEVLEAAKTL
jgi:peroxiredoxin Q/BCP